MKLADLTADWRLRYGGFATSYRDGLSSTGKSAPDSEVELDLHCAIEIGCGGFDPLLCTKMLQKIVRIARGGLERHAYVFERRPKDASLQRAVLRRGGVLAAGILGEPLRVQDLRESSVEFFRIGVLAGPWVDMDEEYALEGIRLALVVEDLDLAREHLGRLMGRRAIRCYRQEHELYKRLVEEWPAAGSSVSGALMDSFDAFFDQIRPPTFSRFLPDHVYGQLTSARIELAGLRDRLMTGQTRWPRVFDYLAGRVDPREVRDPPTGTTDSRLVTADPAASKTKRRTGSSARAAKRGRGPAQVDKSKGKQAKAAAGRKKGKKSSGRNR